MTVGFRIRDLQEIGGNRPAIVLAEAGSNVVSARALLGRVEGGRIGDEFLHAIAVRRKHLGNIGFGRSRFGKVFRDSGNIVFIA